MTNKRTFEFPGQRPASDYEETAELPIHTESLSNTPITPDIDPTHVRQAAEPATSLFDYETAEPNVAEYSFTETPRYQQLSSYERLMNMLWYERRRDFLTIIAALGLLVLGISAFVLLLNDSPAFETAVELSNTEEVPKSTFRFPPAGPSVTPATTVVRQQTQSKQTQAPLTATTTLAASSSITEPTTSSTSKLDALLLEELNQTATSKDVNKDLLAPETTVSETTTTEEKMLTTAATTIAPRSVITPQKESLDAKLTKINFSGNFCASAYTLTLASEERSLDRTVDKSAEACSKLWPAYFTGLVAGQEYQLTIGAAHKETGEIFYSSTSFVVE